MPVKIAWLAVFSLVMGAALSARASDPVGEWIPLDLVIVPDQPIEIKRPNIFDPNHPKDLWFEGVGLAPDGAVLNGFFDWLGEDGQVNTSPVFQIEFEADQLFEFGEHFRIPFCPREVSLDLRVAEGPVEISGSFHHHCTVPEPSAVALAGLGAAGLCIAARRRRAA
jgi:hypothetical protein